MSEEGKPQEGREEVLLVYVGARTFGDKPGDLWLEVSPQELADGKLPEGHDDESNQCYRVYTGKNLKWMKGSPGTVYKVPQRPGSTSIFTGEARYVGLWPDDAQRFEWQARSRVNSTLHEQRKRGKKDSSEDDFAPLLPLRNLYARLIGRGRRAALLAAVVAYITAGRVEE